MPGIYHFGFGGIVSPGLRELRGIETLMTAPAVLNDYRITFAVAGAANIVIARGYEVHGVLMELSQKDWDVLTSYETGYDYTEVDVWTYGDETKFYRARVFIMDSDRVGNEKLPSDRLPQERFLRIIASGMRHHGVDEDYIENEVMNCPYIPKRKPEEYLRFPTISDKIKTIPVHKYLKHASKKNWFAIGDRVFCIPAKSLVEDHPFVTWLKRSYIGHLDVTWTVTRTLYDPDLPKCAFIDDLTEIHHAWCENMMVDYFAQADVGGVQMIGELLHDHEDDAPLRTSRRASLKTQQLLVSCTSLMKKLAHSNGEESGLPRCFITRRLSRTTDRKQRVSDKLSPGGSKEASQSLHEYDVTSSSDQFGSSTRTL
jgi:gamma-glutamylcyclotransferase (GGCT)/AIG2-like uncharacterized protein YtfP